MKRARARKSLAEFARSRGFEPAPHHELLIRELEHLEAHGDEILLVFMPPGSAKSTYVNWLFPAWALGRHPDWNILSASHSTELAERWGRRTRNLVDNARATLRVQISPDSSAAGRWTTGDGGEYYAVGVGVGIAGFRADLGIIDDPFGSREDAESLKIRENRWQWYVDDFSSRLKPGGRRVIMHTRWHDDDLAGRVMRQLDNLGVRYRKLVLPAIATAPRLDPRTGELVADPLGRRPGEYLWDEPSGYDYGAFLRARKAESTPRQWNSLYQQDPVPDEGDYFKRSWLMPATTMPALSTLHVYGASDYAVTSKGGDYTVHVVVGVDPEKRLWLLDLWRGQEASDVWVETFCDLVKKWKPLGWAEETGQIKSGVGPFLLERMRKRDAYVHRESFVARHDKAVRARSIQGRMSMGGLYYPHDAPWFADFEAELARFPAGINDDQVDALGLLGQLLDKVIAGAKPEAKPAPKPRRVVDWFDEKDDGPPSWKVA